jgi:aldose 1-epimerase
MQKTPFGTMAGGGAVEQITLNAGDLFVKVLTLGATVQDVRHTASTAPLVLGFESLSDYERHGGYAGAIVGPVANRISGGAADLNGTTYQFAQNDGTATLHSGPTGLHMLVWTVISQTPDSVTLGIVLCDGLGGFPGNRDIEVTYQVVPPATLSIAMRVTTDAATWVNLASHVYWSLDGSESIREHSLQIAADHYLPTTNNIPTGEICDVAGTGFDLRTARPCAELPPLDHNFCLSDGQGALQLAAVLRGASGMTMHLHTTEPGLQIYDSAGMNTAPISGLLGQPYGPYAGLAIEPQGWPDAPNQPAFPSVTLNAGQTYRQHSTFTFSANQ